MNKRLITVFGATGAQGGGLARAILADPAAAFSVRAVTRKPESDAAVALREAGAEVVAADFDDTASLARALDGAWGAFCVTNFWEHFSPAKEWAQADAMAKCTKDAGLKHVIWSTLEDTRALLPVGSGRMPVLMEKYNVPHFDAKGEANRCFTDRGLPVTLLHTSFYWDNFVAFGMGPQPGPDGELTITLPLGESCLPGIAVEDIGRCALGVFKAGPAGVPQSLGIAGEHLTGTEMAAGFSRVLGRRVKYRDIALDAYRSLGFPGADDLGNMFQFKQEFAETFAGLRQVETSRRLNPQLQSFEQWLQGHKAAFGPE